VSGVAPRRKYEIDWIAHYVEEGVRVSSMTPTPAYHKQRLHCVEPEYDSAAGVWFFPFLPAAFQSLENPDHIGNVQTLRPEWLEEIMSLYANHTTAFNREIMEKEAEMVRRREECIAQEESLLRVHRTRLDELEVQLTDRRRRMQEESEKFENRSAELEQINRRLENLVLEQGRVLEEREARGLTVRQNLTDEASTTATAAGSSAVPADNDVVLVGVSSAEEEEVLGATGGEERTPKRVREASEESEDRRSEGGMSRCIVNPECGRVTHLRRHTLVRHLPFWFAPTTACFGCRTQLVSKFRVDHHRRSCRLYRRPGQEETNHAMALLRRLVSNLRDEMKCLTDEELLKKAREMGASEPGNQAAEDQWTPTIFRRTQMLPASCDLLIQWKTVTILLTSLSADAVSRVLPARLRRGDL